MGLELCVKRVGTKEGFVFCDIISTSLGINYLDIIPHGRCVTRCLNLPGYAACSNITTVGTIIKVSTCLLMGSG